MLCEVFPVFRFVPAQSGSGIDRQAQKSAVVAARHQDTRGPALAGTEADDPQDAHGID
jgi:hypothetical protein